MSSAEEGIFVVIWVLFMILIFVVAIASVAFWIWMLVDCAKYEEDKDNQKLIWLLVLIFAGSLGGLIYFFVQRQPRRKKEGLTGIW